ncbi:MAG: MBL fold metallo-hydrolase [Bacteriovoracaceae bacterium]
MIKVHHLNCGSLCPGNYTVINQKFSQIQELTQSAPMQQAAEITKKLFNIAQNFPFSPFNTVRRKITPYWEKLANELTTFHKSLDLVCHCLLIEDRDQLILVDTGLGSIDIKHKTDRLPLEFLFLANPKLDMNETALFQIKNLGFDPKDVRHIIATHMDVDHIGGVFDFPWAKLHILEPEFQTASNPTTPMGKKRYIKKFWDKHNSFELYDPQKGEENWNQFSKIHLINEISDDIFLVPLPGHSVGHMGIGIESQKLFFVGDAYLSHEQVQSEQPRSSKLIQAYNKIIQSDIDLYTQNLNKIRELYKTGSHKIFCSHDKGELDLFHNLL